MSPLSPILCVALFVPAVEDKKDAKAADLIVGKWVAKVATSTGDVEIALEFDKGDAVTRTVGKTVWKGKYKLPDENTIDMVFDIPGDRKAVIKGPITLTKDKLTIETVENGKKVKTEYTRASK